MSLETPLNRSKKPRAPFPPSTEVVDVETFRFTPIPHKDTKKSTEVSVEQYDHDRDIHRSIAASLRRPFVIDLSDTEDDDDVRILNFKPQNTPFGKRRRINEKGESSNSAPFVCEICTETKTTRDSFSIRGCSHAYCTECVVSYVGSKVQENIINIRCPVLRCSGLLEVEDCREILPPQVFDRWGKAMCEALINTDQKFYCPFSDCSALLIHDSKDAITASECPNCNRLFCVRCNVPWHLGIECEEFEKLNKDEREKDDIMLLHLANQMKWRRCPNCRFYVAKSEGCMYMKCRYAFHSYFVSLR